jgi:hypothetical protein
MYKLLEVRETKPITRGEFEMFLLMYKGLGQYQCKSVYICYFYQESQEYKDMHFLTTADFLR